MKACQLTKTKYQKGTYLLINLQQSFSVSIDNFQVLNHNYPLSVTCRTADNPLEDPEWVTTDDGSTKVVCTKKCTSDHQCAGAINQQVF
jgi:hypothetical protein